MFSPPTVPWRARLTAMPGTWTSVNPAWASMAAARPAMPPITSKPMRTVLCKAVSSSISAAPSASMAVTQCVSLAMSAKPEVCAEIPTLIRMAPPGRWWFGIPPAPSSPYTAMGRRA